MAKNSRKLPPAELKRKLESYFQVYLKKGYSISGLKHFLKDEGYPAKLIDEVAEEYKYKKRAHKKSLMVTLMVAVALLILLIPVYVFLSQGPEVSTLKALEGVTDCGFDNACFVKLADDCNNAVYHQDEEGALVRYETVGCVLKISLEKFDPNEPEEIVALLGNKEMNCKFTRNTFNNEWTNDFLTPVEFCRGELKDALFALRIAQAKLASY